MFLCVSSLIFSHRLSFSVGKYKWWILVANCYWSHNSEGARWPDCCLSGPILNIIMKRNIIGPVLARFYSCLIIYNQYRTWLLGNHFQNGSFIQWEQLKGLIVNYADTSLSTSLYCSHFFREGN